MASLRQPEPDKLVILETAIFVDVMSEDEGFHLRGIAAHTGHVLLGFVYCDVAVVV
jgi:hypothetical protein